MNADYDLRYLEAGLDQLEGYLLSRDIYRPIGIQSYPGETPYPQLTLGWMLLSRLRARASVQTASQKSELERLSQGLEATRTRWRAAWSNKAQAEFRARLNLWRDFLEDYRDNPEANIDRYAYEVNRRVLLHLLADEADSLPSADIQALQGLDLLLRAVFQPGEFVWQAPLAASFPQPTFWYLYGQLKGQIENLPDVE